MAGDITLDTNKFVLTAPIKISHQLGFPDVLGDKQQRTLTDFGLYQQLVLKAPLGLGQRSGEDTSRVFAQQSINTHFSTIVRGPQKQAVALPSGTVAYNKIQDVFGEAWAMEREPGTILSTKTMTKFYFHAATDDRSISGLPTQINQGGGPAFPSSQIMNSTIGTAQTSNTESFGTTTNAHLLFMSLPLAAQSIGSQNWTLQIAREVSDIASSASSWGLRLYVFRPSQQEVVGYIIGSSSAIVEYSSASENTTVDTEQSFEDTVFSGSAVATQQGDILVCEIYCESTTSLTTIFYYDGTTEQSTDNTTVSNHASFIQSANNITISADAPSQQAKPLVYFQASTPEWIDSTIASDTGLNFCQGVVNASERVIALSAYPFGSTGGQDAVFLAWSWDKTTWITSGGPTIQNNQFFIGITVVGTTVNVLLANDHAFPTKWYIATLDDPPTTLTISKTVIGNSFPHSIASFPDSSGAEKAWVTGHNGIYLEDVLIEATRFSDPTSNFTGQMIRCFVGGRDSLVWTDGERLFAGGWDNGGVFNVTDLTSVGIKDGLPQAQQGRITSIDCTTERGWVGVAIGGEDSSHNGSVLTLDETGFHCDYYNSTRNRVIRAIGFSREDDGKSRLLMMEDNGSAGDVNAFMFDDFVENPLEVSSYKYTTTGLLLDSERDMGFGGLIEKGFGPMQADSDNLSTNEKISTKDGQDGVAPANSQDITSATNPPQTWPDKTDGSAGVGVAAKRQQIEWTLTGTEGTTSGPDVKALIQTYGLIPLKPDGTPALVYTLTVSRNPHDYENLGVKVEDILSRLNASYGKQVLLVLEYKVGENINKTVYVKMLPFIVEEKVSQRGDQHPQLDTAPIVVMLVETFR